MSSLSKNLRRLPKVGALALGFGGLFAAEAPAEKSDFQPSAQSTRFRNLARDEVVMFLDGKKESTFLSVGVPSRNCR